MIVQIAVALTLLMIGYGFTNKMFDIATGVTSGVFAEIMTPFTDIARSLMLIFAHLAPVLFLALPYMWYLRHKKGEPAPMMLVWGAVYGVVLYGVVVYTGVDVRMIQTVQQSWSGSVIGGIGAVAQFGWGILTVATYYMAGIALAVISVVLEVVSGIGNIAESGKRHVSRAQAGVLERIIRRLTE